MEIQYLPMKANVIVDALSKRSYVNADLGSHLLPELRADFERLNLGMVNNTTRTCMEEEPTPQQEIHQGQL